MSRIGLDLPVFIASSGDVLLERDLVERIIDVAARLAAAKRLLLRAVRYETHGVPGVDHPSAALKPLLQESELVVVLVWSRMGDGVREELQLAIDLAMAGRSDNVFIYFRTAPPPAGTLREDLEYVKSMRRALTEEHFVWDYDSPDQLATIFQRHLECWLSRWYDLPEICEYGLLHSSKLLPAEMLSGENRADLLKRRWNPEADLEMTSALGALAAWHYQTHAGNVSVAIDRSRLQQIDGWKRAASDSKTAMPLSHNLVGEITWIGPTPLVSTTDGDIFFSGRQWFYYLCSIGLVHAILANDVSLADGTPYVNDVHQYMRAVASPHRREVIRRLENWLTNKDGVTQGRPVARNFAAYELGMLEALESQDVLIAVAEQDDGRDVRLYCVASLGKLRSRRALPMLSQMHAKQTDHRLRLMIAQAVCRITGVAPYEL